MFVTAVCVFVYACNIICMCICVYMYLALPLPHSVGFTTYPAMVSEGGGQVIVTVELIFGNICGEVEIGFSINGNSTATGKCTHAARSYIKFTGHALLKLICLILP